MAWVSPTAAVHVTSHFNPSRRHPVYGTVMPHTGTDYRAPTGTPIRAASAGVVARSTFDSRAGNYVRIDHGGGTWTGYSHLSVRHVSVGQRVAAGQTIGLSGATGSVTAAHLHFEVSVNGVKVNPVPFLAARATTIAHPLPGGGGPNIPTPGGTLPAPIEEDPLAAFTEEQLRRMIRDEIRTVLGIGGANLPKSDVPALPSVSALGERARVARDEIKWHREASRKGDE